jgi:hypothetical protein
MTKLKDFKKIEYTFKILFKGTENVRQIRKIDINPKIGEDFSNAVNYLSIIYPKHKYDFDIAKIKYYEKDEPENDNLNFRSQQATVY